MPWTNYSHIIFYSDLNLLLFKNIKLPNHTLFCRNSIHQSCYMINRNSDQFRGPLNKILYLYHIFSSIYLSIPYFRGKPFLSAIINKLFHNILWLLHITLIQNDNYQDYLKDLYNLDRYLKLIVHISYCFNDPLFICSSTIYYYNTLCYLDYILLLHGSFLENLKIIEFFLKMC